ncbi:MAG: PE family protein, partial [Pseudomonadota bacterium]|nr:PE family protein [Pseudomonadota bacterium]
NARGAGGATTGGAGVSSTLGPGPGGGGGGGGISTTNMVRTGGTGAYGHLSGSVGRRANQVMGAAAGLGGNGGSNKAGR